MGPSLATTDAFYAITDLMRFAAFSLCQLLNPVESTISREAEHAVMRENGFDV